MIGRAYRSVVPERVRGWLWHARRRMKGRLHEFGWKLRSGESHAERARRRLAIGDDFWLFVLGCNNSGTTLMLRILEGHPGIRSLGREGHDVTEGIKKPAQLGVGRIFSKRLDYFRMTEESDSSNVPRMLYDWAPRFEPPPGILLEKSPPNTLRSRWLQKNFAPARFLATTRLPYAVCEGMRRRIKVPIEEAAEHWKRVHEVLREDMRRLDHCILYRYEDFCEDADRELGRIEGFLELSEPFDRSAVSGGNLNVHNITGRPQHLQNMNMRSLKRLTPDDYERINEVIGDEMCHFGYDRMDGPPQEEAGE